MENFVVSARKYRPATFDTVIGQEHVVKTLKNAIRNHQLAHAFLFCGPRGVGKTTTARLLAKTINCKNLTPHTEACNECDSCLAFLKNASFNIYELDAASNNSVEDIRALVDQVRYAPQGAKYKIYIIDEVHMLSSSAFNAFLKTLEEPPPYAKFILATTEKHKILPTILSRCQVFDFHRIGVKDAVKQLKQICEKENVTAEDEALHMIALKAEGAMRDALSIFDRIVSYTGSKITYNDVIENLNILDYDYYFKATNMLLSNNMSGILLMFDEILAKGFDALQFINGFAEHIRNLMICKFPDTTGLLDVSENVASKYKQQAHACSAGFLLNALNLLNTCELGFKQSNNQRLHVELTLLKLCNLMQVIKPNTQQPPVDEKKKMTENIIQPNDNAAVISKPEGINPTQTQQYKQPVSDIQPVTSTSKLEKLKLQVKQQLQNQRLAEEVNGKEVAVIDEPEQKNQFTFDEFLSVWNEFLIQLDKQNKTRISSFLKNANTTRIDDFTIEVELRSKLEEELFDEERMNMIPYFRKNLQNSFFDFKTRINEDLIDTTSKPTKQELLKILTEENQHLKTLIQKLGLEIDY